MDYLHWDEQTITEKTAGKNGTVITDMYDRGYVLTRKNIGVMQQTRSVRINLSRFELTSENRRILRKGKEVTLARHIIPYTDYSWEIGKMAKDFYDEKADGAFSVNKVRKLITTTHNFNLLLEFKKTNLAMPARSTPACGYAICYESTNAKNGMIHYSYPFYDLTAVDTNTIPKNIGLIMMTSVIALAKDRGLRYVYLGSLQRPTDIYKLQFEGIEWFDGTAWQTDIELAKKILAN